MSEDKSKCAACAHQEACGQTIKMMEEIVSEITQEEDNSKLLAEAKPEDLDFMRTQFLQALQDEELGFKFGEVVIYTHSWQALKEFVEEQILQPKQESLQ